MMFRKKFTLFLIVSITSLFSQSYATAPWDLSKGGYFFPKLTIQLKEFSSEEADVDCIVVGLYEGMVFTDDARRIDRQCKGYLSQFVQNGDFKGKVGEALMLYSLPGLKSPRLLLMGCGPEGKVFDKEYFEIITASMEPLSRGGIKKALSYLPSIQVEKRDLKWKLRMAARQSETSLYDFEQFKKSIAPERALKTLLLGYTPYNGNEAEVFTGLSIAKGMALAMDLGNLPANILTPVFLENAAKQIAKNYPSLSVESLDFESIKKMGMGAFHAVAKGDPDKTARLIVLKYSGGKEGDAPYAFVGKGITFDSGGISIKPSENMHEMKYDMMGAATVLGLLSIVAELEIPINVVGVMACTPNLPDGLATVPGDVVQTLNGKTIEIMNTDAEGRLVLADALAYTETFKPQVIIDIATLTGAAVAALGNHPSALMSNDEELVKDLEQAGDFTYDRVWRLPLWPEYQEQIKSKVADVQNMSTKPKNAGSIVGGAFLQNFVKNEHWAHLDIAGTAYDNADTYGATGRPIPLLVQYLLDRTTTNP